MTSTRQRSLFKALLLSGAIFTGWAAQAQVPSDQPPIGNNPVSDTARPESMRRHHRPGGPDGMRPGDEGPGGREGFRRGGPEGFGGPGKGDWSHRGPGGRTRGGWTRHGEGIRYTPEQRKQLMAINKEFHQKQTDLYAKDNITLKEYKAGLIGLHKDKKARLEALLTPQQKEQIANRKKMAAENRQVMAAAHMERLKLRLNLTDDQVSKLKSGQDALHQQAKAIHENDNLLPQQKMQQMKDLMAKRNDVYKSVLTPDQFTKFEQMSQHRRGPGGFGPGGPGGPGGRGGFRGDRGDRGADRGDRPETAI